MSNGPLARVVRTGLAICALTAAACGGGSSSDRMPSAPSETAPGPTASPPAPPPSAVTPATIHLDGDGKITDCARRDQSTTRCTFQETGRNVGPGCATAIRIDVRLMAGETELLTQRWGSGATRVFMPGEEFTYSLNLILPTETFATVTQYGRTAAWNAVRCPG